MKNTFLVLCLLAAMTGLLPAQNAGTVKSLSLSNNSAVVSFSASPNYLYDIERSTNFTGWTKLVTTNVPGGGNFQFTDLFLDLSGQLPRSAYYRLRMPGPATNFTVSGFPVTLAAGLSSNLTVTARDSGGNIATGYRGTVHFTSSDAQAVLPADYIFTSADSGVHVFSVTLKTSGTQSITAKDSVTALITGSQSGITVTPGTAVSLAVTGYPNPQTAGNTNNATITAKDVFGNTAPSYRGTVHLTCSDVLAVLPADYTFTAGDNGIHALSVIMKTAATQTLTVTDTGSSITGTQSGIAVKAAAAATMTLTGFPIAQTAGVAGNATVTTKDVFGNLATGYRGTLHWTSSDGQAALPANYTFTAGDNGAHTFSITLKTVGTQSITAADTVTSTLTNTQSGITINPAGTAVLAITGFPSPQTAGVASNLTVSSKDAFGNATPAYRGTVHFTSSDAQAVLPADYAFTAGDSGIHTFSATLKTAGSDSITATDTVTNTITGSQAGITINAITAVTLTVAGYPNPQTAGNTNNATVTARDNFGNAAPSYRGTVHLTCSDGAAVLPADYTFTAGDNGIHALAVIMKTAATQNLGATDTGNSSITGTQTGIVVKAAPAATMTLAGFPASQTAGVSGTTTVTMKDAFGNLATGYRGTVHWSSSDGQATLPANYAFTAGDNGAHTFSVTLKTAGSQSITAADTVTATLTNSQSGITINPAGTAVLAVTGFPNPQTAGVSANLTVSAKDAFGNATPAYLGTVHFTSADAQAVLPANYTFTPGDSGIHQFSATFKTAGSESITATDTVTNSITGAQSGITINAAAPVSLTVTGFANPETAGVATNFTVTAKDTFGNVATGYRGTVHTTSSDAQASLPADYTFTAGDNGIHTLSATLKTAGTQSITATDTVNGSLTAAQVGISIIPAPPSQFILSGYPNPQNQFASDGFVTVTATDPYGNLATGYRGTVHITSSDAAAVLPPDYTFTAGDAGIHAFNVTLNTASPPKASITATDKSNSSITGTQAGINVIGGGS